VQVQCGAEQSGPLSLQASPDLPDRPPTGQAQETADTDQMDRGEACRMLEKGRWECGGGGLQRR